MFLFHIFCGQNIKFGSVHYWTLLEEYMYIHTYRDRFQVLLNKRKIPGIYTLQFDKLSIPFFFFILKCKVLSLLEAYFDLISGSTLSMKIQIMGGKITENLGLKSPLPKVKIFCSFFFSFSNSSHKSGYLLFKSLFDILCN